MRMQHLNGLVEREAQIQQPAALPLERDVYTYGWQIERTTKIGVRHHFLSCLSQISQPSHPSFSLQEPQGSNKGSSRYTPSVDFWLWHLLAHHLSPIWLSFLPLGFDTCHPSFSDPQLPQNLTYNKCINFALWSRVPASFAVTWNLIILPDLYSLYMFAVYLPNTVILYSGTLLLLLPTL